MAYGLIHRLRVDSGIEAVVNVQANPGVTVTLIGSDKTTMFTAVADSTTGLATITVNIPDTYAIGTDISTDSFAEGNTTSIDISESKTYTAQFIKLNKGYTECGCTNAYKSNSLLVWWNGTKPTEYFSGWYCIDTDDNSETTGEGEVYQISSSISYRGFIKDVSSGTTKTYKVGAYITINGKNYYSASDTVTGTAKTISLNSFVKYTSSQTITVPEGCHSITAYCVGGGGGGGDCFKGPYDHPYRCAGGGGGGGGYTSSKKIVCTPGQNISILIGNGGSGGSNGGQTKITVNTDFCIANGGNTGGGFNGWGDKKWYTLYGCTGGSGGSGGGGGGIGSFAGISYNSAQPNGGNGGTNGGNGSAGEKMITAASGSLNVGPGGSGQGSSTNINGVTYSGGGGGGGLNSNGGSNGGGRGGAVQFSNQYKATATSGTANSGGGGGAYYSSDVTIAMPKGASGGSGVAFITFNP